MTKRGYGLLCLAALVLIAGALVAYLWRKPTGEQQEDQGSEPVATSNLPGPTPLPEYFEAPNLVSRRFGFLRIYVAIKEEISIRQTGGKGASSGLLHNVPIVVILENESYRSLDVKQDVAADAELFSVVVSRGEGANREEVFVSRKSSAEITGWQPAERKSFTIDWPVDEALADKYLISVTPGFGDRKDLQIRTVLK